MSTGMLVFIALMLVVTTPGVFSISSSVVVEGVDYFCSPQYHPSKTTADFNKASAEVVALHYVNDETCDPRRIRSSYTFNASDLAAVQGKIAVVPGSTCLFSAPEDDGDPYKYYLEDFQSRVDEAFDAGAVGVLWGEGIEGKYPMQMIEHLGENFNQAKPVCVMSKETFDDFVSAITLPDASYKTVDTSNTLMYRLEDEKFPDPLYTYITVEEAWMEGGPNGLEFPIVAKAATFNPLSAMATEAELVRAEFFPGCNSLEYASCAQNCWNLITPFTHDVRSKIVMFVAEEDEDFGCYNDYPLWAYLAQKHGALAVIHGATEHDSTGANLFDIPYLVPFELTIPYFTLLKVHTDALLHADAESLLHVNHDVVIKTPPLRNGAGPSYLANTVVDLGQTPLMVWKNAEESFFCDAGQAGFNPAPWSGLPLPSDPADVAALNSNRVVVLTPSEACEAGTNGSSTCGGCLTQTPKEQVSHAWSFMDNYAQVLPLDPIAPAELPGEMTDFFGPNFVAAILVEDFDCFVSYEEFVRMAVAAGASAVILIEPFSPYAAPSVYDTAGVNGSTAREIIPAFTITWLCAARAFDQAESIHVELPAINARGEAELGLLAQAAGYAVPSAVSMPDSVFAFDRGPPSLCGGGGRCMAGQASFNPENYPGVKANVMLAETVESCRSSFSCLMCDRYSSGEGASGRLGKYVNVDAENIRLGDVAGHVVYVHASQLVCMRPFVNVVKDLQDAGALAVIMGNEVEDAVTLTAPSSPYEITIPIFNVAMSDGETIMRALRDGEIVSVITPRIEDGAAVTTWALDPNDGSLLLGRGYDDGRWTGGGRRNLDPGGVAGFFIFFFAICVVGVAVARWRRDRNSTDQRWGWTRSTAGVATTGGIGAVVGSVPSRARPYERFDEIGAPSAGDVEMAPPPARRGGVSFATSPSGGIAAVITGEGRGVPLFTDETYAPGASTRGVPEMVPSMRGENSEVSTREIPIPRSPSPSFGDSVRPE